MNFTEESSFAWQSFWLVDLLHKGVLRSGFFMFLAELLEIRLVVSLDAFP